MFEFLWNTKKIHKVTSLNVVDCYLFNKISLFLTISFKIFTYFWLKKTKSNLRVRYF